LTQEEKLQDLVDKGELDHLDRKYPPPKEGEKSDFKSIRLPKAVDLQAVINKAKGE
jgi:hypothetical protein